jgi:tetratricopeptide (TPR) repeat protein
MPEQAITPLRRAAELDPRSSEVRYNLGTACLNMGRLDEAIAALQEAVKLDPRSARAVAQLGTAYGLRGDTARALEFLRKAVELDPQHVRARTNIALLLEKQGNYTEAVPHLEKLVELDPESPRAHALAPHKSRAEQDWVGSLYLGCFGHGRPRGRSVDCRPSRFAVCSCQDAASKGGNGAETQGKGEEIVSCPYVSSSLRQQPEDIGTGPGDHVGGDQFAQGRYRCVRHEIAASP